MSETFEQSYLEPIPTSTDAFNNNGDAFSANSNIQSANFSPNTSAGWQLAQNGDATLNNVVIKGKITATAGGAIGGWSINNTSIYTGTEDHSGYTANAGDITIYSDGLSSSIHAKNFYIDNTGSFVSIGGVLDGTTTLGGRAASILATAIDASGHFADNAISTATGTILGGFTFGASGAIQIGTYSAGVTGDIRISPTGILGRDKNNATTFSINATTGVAVLNGLVVGTNVGQGTAVTSSGVTTIIGNTVTTGYVNALSITAGSVAAENITGTNISGKTITGSTLQTGTSGQNINISTTAIQLRSGTSVVAYWDQSGQGGTGYLYTNAIGTNVITVGQYILGNGSDLSISANTLPYTARTRTLGSASYMWSNVYTDAVQITKSGYTTKYITMNTSNNFEMNTGLYVGGTLSKSAGSFRIDHPLKPDTHYLQHSFVESPDMLNLYTGNGVLVNGICEIQMPDWFIALNGEKDFTYQLTPYGQNSLCIAEEMDKNGKVVFAGTKDGKFSYLITAIRHDKYAEENRIKIELEK